MGEENKLEPKLRFPEFKNSESWVLKKIEEISDQITAGGTPSTTEKSYWGGQIRWMNSGELNLKKVYEVQGRITELGLRNSSTKIIPKNSVLIGLAGQGKTRGTIAMNMVDLCINQSISAIYPKPSKYSSDYLYHNLDNRYDELRSLSAGGEGRGGLNLQIIKSLEIPLPGIKEQQKIADCLSSLDDLITAQNLKVEALKQHKKGLMQQLFPAEGETVPKLRFPEFENDGEWGGSFLGNHCEITTGKLDANAMVEDGQYRFYTCAKNYYQIDNYAFDTDALLISGNGANVGYIHHYKGKFNAYQRTYVLDKFNQNIVFIKYLLENSLHKRIAVEKKDGNTPYIVMSTLTEMDIRLPKAQEQKSIAECLSSLDELITTQTQQLEDYKIHKQGLMQQLFPSLEELTQ